MTDIRHLSDIIILHFDSYLKVPIFIILMAIFTNSEPQFLLLEDDGLVRSGMKNLIQLAEPLAKIHEACSYDEAIVIASSHQIDIAFLDYDLKSDKNGIDVLTYIRHMGHDTRVLMLSAEQNKDFVMYCINAGATGYIPKAMDDDGNLFRRALDIALSGGVFLPQTIFSSDHEYSSRNAAKQVQDSLEDLNINGRLLEVLYYVCQGDLYKIIANKMCIAEGTVRKDYVPKLLRLFKVTRRTQLIAEVARRGIVIPKPQSLNRTE